MTAKEAYDCDPTFRALVEVWVNERRCPLVLAERAQELDLAESVKTCAEWAATEPESASLGSAFNDVDCPFDSPPYPRRTNLGLWYWSVVNNAQDVIYHHRVFGGNVSLSHCRCLETCTDAILWLLDNWILEPNKE